MITSDYISVDPEICHGKPCFRGTRIMLSTLLELLEAGKSSNEILEQYPELSETHIRAALHLASQMFAGEQVLPLRSV